MAITTLNSSVAPTFGGATRVWRGITAAHATRVWQLRATCHNPAEATASRRFCTLCTNITLRWRLTPPRYEQRFRARCTKNLG